MEQNLVKRKNAKSKNLAAIFWHYLFTQRWGEGERDLPDPWR